MAGINVDSPKYIEARKSLPVDLQPVFDELVSEYAFLTTKHYGMGYVAYRVIAELVRAGWRKLPLEQMPDNREKR